MLKISTELHQFIEQSGSFKFNYNLKKINWFQVGGNTDLFFRPKSKEELQIFLQKKGDLPIFVMGVGSNIIIRDGGFRGCVIRLGRGFTELEKLPDMQLKVGAANLDLNVALFSQMVPLSGFEFLSGIPGTIGGAIKMNAGAYGGEMSQILVKACGYDLEGRYHEFGNEEMNYEYRKSSPPKEMIYTHTILRGSEGVESEIKKRIKEIQEKRETTQPIRNKTGGSTFKNPTDKRAWEVIDKAGCRGLCVGDAMMSEKHCNFMINTGNATAKDLEKLGNMVRAKVKDHSGVELKWEIKIIGESDE